MAGRPRSRRLAFLIATVVLIAPAIGLAPGPAAAAPPAVEDKRGQIDRLQHELAALDARAGAAAEQLNAALDALDLIRASLRQTELELRDASRDIGTVREQVADRVAALYRSPRPGIAELLLASDSLSRIQAHLDLLQRLTRSDSALIRRIAERRARLAGLRARQVQDRARAGDAVTRAADRRRQVLALLARRREVLASAEADLRRLIAAEKARLARLAAEKAAREAAARAATGAPYRVSLERPSLPGGQHVFPIAGPTTFSDDWLNARGGGRLHVGIDLLAARGTPVVAVADGTLFRVGYNGLGGWRLWLRDTAGTTYYYAHMDAFAAPAIEGAGVSRGDVVGFVGTTGDAQGTSPHLHFEIHPGGAGPTRPYPIVSAWPRA